MSHTQTYAHSGYARLVRDTILPDTDGYPTLYRQSWKLGELFSPLALGDASRIYPCTWAWSFEGSSHLADTRSGTHPTQGNPLLFCLLSHPYH